LYPSPGVLRPLDKGAANDSERGFLEPKPPFAESSLPPCQGAIRTPGRGIPAQLITAFALILFLASPAFSATINVTANAPDELGANGSCSLREAIQNINDGVTTFTDCAPTGAYGTSDTINIPAGTYTTTLAGSEFLNANGSYDIMNSVSIVGAGASTTTINGGGLDRVFFIYQYTTGGLVVSISGVTVTGGVPANGYGGGIYNYGTLNVTNSTISGNTAGYGGGGGIYNIGGTLTVTSSTITGNTASGEWGCGGGIYIGATTTYPYDLITNSTISGNTATDGGGMYNYSNSLRLTNSTISGNTASSGWGGGMYNHRCYPTVLSSTISANSGGGICNFQYMLGTSGTYIANSIVANQTSGADCSGGNITSYGFNLESGASCNFTFRSGGGGSGDLQNTNPKLGPLADNGGPTQTMALLSGSPAIDNGYTTAPTDQRGIARPQGARADIGAFEYAAPPLPTPPPAATLVSPSGAITTTTPTYTWNAVAGATSYQLWVKNSAGVARINANYTSTDAGCPAGTGICSITPATALVAGAHNWWVKAYNAAGWGPFSAAKAFTTVLPKAATLVSPSGVITTPTPTYTWNAVPGAAKYALLVKNPGTTQRISVLYTSAQAGCASGVGTCSITPATALVNGTGSWLIHTWNPIGYGPWSAAKAFTKR